MWKCEIRWPYWKLECANHTLLETIILIISTLFWLVWWWWWWWCRVLNIEEVSARAASTNFTTHHDHSKWVVAREPDKPYVCIGDINRMVSFISSDT